MKKLITLMLIFPLMILTAASSPSDSANIQPETVQVELTPTNSAILGSEFSRFTIPKLINKIRRLDQLSENGPIYLVLDTPGGELFAGNELVRACNSTRRGVITITIHAASMGFMLVQLNKGKRLIVEEGGLMHHQISTTLQGDRLTLHNKLDALDKLHDSISKKIMNRSGVSLENYNKNINHEYNCVDYGCVTEGFADAMVSATCSSKFSTKLREEITVSKNVQGGRLDLVTFFNPCPIDTIPVKQVLRVNGKDTPTVVTSQVLQELFKNESKELEKDE